MNDNSTNKRELKNLTETVRIILMRNWDPIGVSDWPEAGREYDAYVGPVTCAAQLSDSHQSIESYLREVEEVSMGIGGVDSASNSAARARAASAVDLIRSPPQYMS